MYCIDKLPAESCDYLNVNKFVPFGITTMVKNVFICCR